MTRSPNLVLVALCLVVASCSGDADLPATTTTSIPTTTTSSMPTTTSTTIPFTLEDSPPALTAAIETFYAYATGESTTEPVAPQQVLESITPGGIEIPARGSASLGMFQGRQLAVVSIEDDVFLVVEDDVGWRIVGGEWPSLSVPAYYGVGPRHVAVVGSDARPGQDVARSRADSIHFVSLDGSGGGAVVGLPRDSFIPVPGFGRRKITTSLSLGGPDPMVAAFAELTGLPFEGYVLTGFAGFESLLGEVLGGVSVDVPFPINDRWAHVNIDAGSQILDGAQALGFARARKTVPGGDFARSEHQGVILIAAAQAVQAMGLSALPELMELSEPHLMTDLTPEQLLTFSAMAITANLGDVPNVVAPGSPGTAGAASVVFLHGSADDLWVDLADGTLDD